MFVNSIDVKPFFIRPDGAIVRDLTQTMFELKNRNYIAYNIFRVPKDYVMRPDLISKSVYNNSLYAEMILKYNGISNPFSIDEGEVILIPNLESTQDALKSKVGADTEDSASKIRNSYKYIDPTKIPKKSKEEKQFDKRSIKIRDQVSVGDGALPPNIAEEGETQITYRNGRVYFGEGAETCLQNGMSASEFLTTVIKSSQT